MNYALKATSLVLVLWGLTFALGHAVDARLYHAHFPFVLAFFGLSSVALHAGIEAALKENPKRFPAYFMGLSGIKMLVYMLGIGIYVFVQKEESVPIIALFLISYVLFTVLELVSILPKAQRMDTSDGQKKG